VPLNLSGAARITGTDAIRPVADAADRDRMDTAHPGAPLACRLPSIVAASAYADPVRPRRAAGPVGSGPGERHLRRPAANLRAVGHLRNERAGTAVAHEESSDRAGAGPVAGPTPKPATGEAGGGDPGPGRQPPLSATDRAEALATGRVPIDRSAALRAGSAPVPRRFIHWVIVGFAVLGLGGVVAEHFVGNAGVGSPTTSPTTLAGTGSAAPPAPVPPGSPPITSSLNAFIGLTRLAGNPAPVLALHDQSGAPWTMAGARGEVVVLTFFNSECNDICPVLAGEIEQADGLLGARGADVEFVIVNSDPRSTSPEPVPPALVQTGLLSQAHVVFLDGALSDLNRIWSSYGVTVEVQRSTQVVTHTDVMDFIGPSGSMELRATPFADEDQLGVYSLDPNGIHRFAQGIAGTAAGLLGTTS
jgi:cytochrome oxidase Cu insertion factor (SCO1/SenC/PrrC family)